MLIIQWLFIFKIRWHRFTSIAGSIASLRLSLVAERWYYWVLSVIINGFHKLFTCGTRYGSSHDIIAFIQNVVFVLYWLTTNERKKHWINEQIKKDSGRLFKSKDEEIYYYETDTIVETQKSHFVQINIEITTYFNI